MTTIRPRREVLALAAVAMAGLAGCLSGDGSGDDESDDGAGGGNGDGTGDRSADPAETRVLSAEVDREQPTAPAEDVDALVHGLNAFGLDLLRELDGEENQFVSPFSISLALAMTWAGARGETETEMAEVLRFPHDQETLHPAYNAFWREVEGGVESEGAGSEGSDGRTDDEDGDEEDETPFTLRVANATWGQDDYPFADDFLETLARNYGAGLHALDFGEDPEAARVTINDWVAEETEERIDELLPEGALGEDTRLVLTNAVYFLANWVRQFDPEDTTEEVFTAIDGTESAVPTMHQTLRTNYAEVDGTDVLELPYAGGDATMVLLVPPAGEFEAFRDALDVDRLSELFDATVDASGDLALPRFSYDSSIQLQSVLSTLGMPSAFDESAADFSGMTDAERLYVDDVYHDAYVAVDEEGTEAAAATGVVMEPVSAPLETFDVAVDRPFCFAIRDDGTGGLLFLGQVVDAAAAQE